MTQYPRKTQVGIIGSGPAGLMLSQLLHNAGIDNVVIDRQSREHIEARVRAGVLEQGTVKALHEAGVSQRLLAEGLPHDGFHLSFDGELHRIDLKKHTGQHVTVYGQTELTKDLIQRRLDQNAPLIFSADNVTPDALISQSPCIHFEKDGTRHTVQCEFVVGCDGFHGISRQSIPDDVLRVFERVYPFGWLGILCEAPPIAEELIYANHPNGFALCSMRSPSRSRYYIQCDTNDNIENWDDARFYDELEIRLGDSIAASLVRGDSFEKSIAPLRSFVAEPMRYGNLFLAGDAAHIVPPTGAKGLNLAIADVRILHDAFIKHYRQKDSSGLENYSTTCLQRVWKVERFSWYLSMLMHQIPTHSDFEKKMQRAEFDYIRDSEAASKSIAENYIGLPLNI